MDREQDLLNQINSLRSEMEALQQNLMALEAFVFARDKELVDIIHNLSKGHTNTVNLIRLSKDCIEMYRKNEKGI